MKTSLVEGKRIADFDEELLKELPNGIPPLGEIDPITLGVENDDGEIYRLIETGDVLANKKFTDRLRNIGYFVDPLAPDDKHSLWAIIRRGSE